jgi:hypothetical protein
MIQINWIEQRHQTARGTQMPYFYLPLAYYNGAVLKCAGIATADNRGWFKEQHPDAVELDAYYGDRIRAYDWSEVKYS